MAKKAIKKESGKIWEHEFAGKALLAFVNELGVTVEDALMVCLENGIAVRVVDQSHVMMMTIKIGDGEEVGLSFGVQLRNIKEALAGYTKLNKKETQMVTMKYDDNTGQLHLDMGDKNYYTVRCLDKETMTPPQMPDMAFPVEVVVKDLEVKKLLLSMNKQRTVGDLVEFSTGEDGFALNTRGSCSNWVSIFDAEVKVKGVDTELVSQYSLTYILPLLRQWKAAKEIKIEFGDRFPLKLSANTDVGGHVIESMAFLAPRVENDY